MTGPASLRAIQLYSTELASQMFDAPSEVDKNLLVYLSQAIANGGSISFTSDKRKPTLAYLHTYECWPVIKPYTHSDKKTTHEEMKQILKAWDVLQKLLE